MSPASYRAAPPRVGSARLLSVVRHGKSAPARRRPGPAGPGRRGGLPRRRRLRAGRCRRGRLEALLGVPRLLERGGELLLSHPVGREVAALQRRLALVVRRLRVGQRLLQLLLGVLRAAAARAGTGRAARARGRGLRALVPVAVVGAGGGLVPRTRLAV